MIKTEYEIGIFSFLCVTLSEIDGVEIYLL